MSEETKLCGAKMVIALRDGTIRDQKAEIKRLKADNEYVRDRLVSRDDPDRDTITIRALIDEATNSGDFFPASELKRQREARGRHSQTVANVQVVVELQKQEIERLTRELASVTADYEKHVENLDHAMDDEVRKLQLAAIAAHSMLCGPHGEVTVEYRAEVFTKLNQALGGQDAIMEILAAEAAKDDSE